MWLSARLVALLLTTLVSIVHSIRSPLSPTTRDQSAWNSNTSTFSSTFATKDNTKDNIRWVSKIGNDGLYFVDNSVLPSENLNEEDRLELEVRLKDASHQRIDDALDCLINPVCKSFHTFAWNDKQILVDGQYLLFTASLKHTLVQAHFYIFDYPRDAIDSYLEILSSQEKKCSLKSDNLLGNPVNIKFLLWNAVDYECASLKRIYFSLGAKNIGPHSKHIVRKSDYLTSFDPDEWYVLKNGKYAQADLFDPETETYFALYDTDVLTHLKMAVESLKVVNPNNPATTRMTSTFVYNREIGTMVIVDGKIRLVKNKLHAYAILPSGKLSGKLGLFDDIVEQIQKKGRFIDKEKNILFATVKLVGNKPARTTEKYVR